MYIYIHIYIYIYIYIHDKIKTILFSNKTFMVFFEDFAQILRQPFSTTPINACFQNSLGLSRPIAVNFCLCTTKTTHSRDILFPDILLSVLPFLNFI